MQEESQTPVLERLGRSGLTFADTLKLCREAVSSPPAGFIDLKLGVSSNVTPDVLTTYLQRHALLQGRLPSIVKGGYDAHFENASLCVSEGVDCLLIQNVFDNLAPQFEARISAMTDAAIDEHRKRFVDMLQLTLREASPIRRVLVTDLHQLTRPSASLPDERLSRWVTAFNESLHAVAEEHRNVRVISSREALLAVGWERAVNARNYLRYKAPYTPEFCDELARHTVTLATAGDRFLKALVLDCDNTLWGGIIGEDLLGGIQLSPESYPGVVYHLAQRTFAELQSRGILLCLCSKNNAADVDEVFQQHPDMILRDDMIVARRVNWESKVRNISELAEELNIGLDAMAFIDDSSFECESVRSALPRVRVYQVPKDIHRFGETLERVRHDFLAGIDRQDGVEKTLQYRRRAEAMSHKANFESHAEYLASLDLRVRVQRNEVGRIARIAELSQKSNQFNLTTRRYSETEIQALMAATDADVFSVHVSDKFGDSGLTGIVVVRHEETQSRVEAFLMSCRVLGRGIEQSLWRPILDVCRDVGSQRVLSRYIRSAKNGQVAEFYDGLGFSRLEGDDSSQEYALDLTASTIEISSHVTLEYVH